MALDALLANPTVELLLYLAMSSFSGVILLSLASYVVPRIVDRITPNIDDEKEILRGNIAVGNYVGMVTASAILGISIILAAAIIASLM